MSVIEKTLKEASGRVKAFKCAPLFSLLADSIFKRIINSRLGIWFLHFCAAKNLHITIEFLVRHGANIDAAGKEGNTTLAHRCNLWLYRDSRNGCNKK